MTAEDEDEGEWGGGGGDERGNENAEIGIRVNQKLSLWKTIFFNYYTICPQIL